jgi:exopolyphosphatase/guanosine-5'-triphosphate,3'-diphosphate pyrophosphatase
VPNPHLAAVDVGSNTVHVLVAEVHEHDQGPRLQDVAHHVEMPQLGAEVARTGRIGPRKSEETIAALRSVLGRAADNGYDHLVAGATAAVRRAADGAEFLARASKEIGTPVRLISDRREAELSFDGVASRHAAPKGWLMADVGGGSTELVVANGRHLEGWASLELGSGSFAERFLSDPPLPGERDQLRAAAMERVREAPDSAATKFVVTGGTAANLPVVLSRRRPPSLLTTAALLVTAGRLDSAPATEVAAAVGLSEGRVRALRGGVEILLLLLDYYGLDRFHVSYEGLRHGMLLAYLACGDDWWLSG